MFSSPTARGGKTVVLLPTYTRIADNTIGPATSIGVLGLITVAIARNG